MSTVRRRAYYSGRVQGVGFRFTGRRLAQHHGVGGYVRNLPDGRVELLAEGERADVDALLDSVHRNMHDYIRNVEVVDEPPDDPPLSGFTIRH